MKTSCPLNFGPHATWKQMLDQGSWQHPSDDDNDDDDDVLKSLPAE